MANLDATGVADMAVRLGLVTPDLVQDAWNELGLRGGEAGPFLRVLERRGALTPWQSSKLLKQDPDGYFLGGFRILYKIASGSFGRVYRAEDSRVGRVVAIKVLRRKWSEDKHSIELFEREGRVGMTLRHPNIVEILAVNRDMTSHQYYIVMEFVEGGNLKDFLAIRKKLEPPEALRILEDVTSGLHYALGKGLTHRDMKLTNVLISSQGPAKLVDFGLAGIYGKGQEDGLNVDRTVDYAGLEKATNVAHGDTRSDIFFLGCVAYQILTGRAPLEMPRHARDRMLRERFLNLAPIEPSEINGPGSVIRLVETMMSLNPQDRFQTPSQLLDAIREVRREVDGKASQDKDKSGPRTIFVVEKDDRLQDVLREKLKEKGFRVLIGADPLRALDRFRQKPFDVLIVNAGTTGENGMLIFERIVADAERHGLGMCGILMLNDDQADWTKKLVQKPNVAALVQPIKLKKLLATIEALKPQTAASE